MPCYFFHIENGERLSSDEGEEFSDDKAALHEAEAIARDLSKNNISLISLRVQILQKMRCRD